jgi:hypothetical protein
VASLRRRLAQVIAQLPALLDDPQLPRLGRERLLRLFFSNLRALYLAAELAGEDDGHALPLPGGPAALVELLVERGLGGDVADLLRPAAVGRGAVPWSCLRDILVQGLEVATSRRAWREVKAPAVSTLTLSVVVVTRNRARLLERCLASLAGQKRAADEIVVVDNGSTDDTAEVVRGFAPACPLRLVHEARPGVGRARVAGCAAASGDVLAFIDDDAIADEHWLAALEQCFAFDDHVGLVGGRIDSLAGGRSDWVVRAFRRSVEVEAC